jgi:hypothetical protein
MSVSRSATQGRVDYRRAAEPFAHEASRPLQRHGHGPHEAYTALGGASFRLNQ